MRPEERKPEACATLVARSAAAFRHAFTSYSGKSWLHCVSIALIGFVVRAPALQGQLIWDDQFLARDNPFIKSPLLILEAFRHHLFLDSFSAHYRPVQNISLIVDYFFWNTDTYGFHLTNVLLHLVSGVLLYFLLRKLLPSFSPVREQTADQPTTVRRDLSLVAWIVALLWTVHPVHSAAIDYISGRADSLAFAFACGGWLLFLRAGRQVSRLPCVGLFALAALCGLLALCSRESAFIWIALFLIHLFAFQPRLQLRPKLMVLSCCLCVVAAYAGLRQLPERRPAENPSAGWSQPVRATLMMRALGDYGRLMIFPANLHMERTLFDPALLRDREGWRRSVAVEYLSVFGLAVLAALTLGASRKGPARQLRVFGAIWFFAAFLPISNLVDLNATVAEHWLYLPSVGLLIFLGGCALELPQRSRSIAVVFALLWVAGLSARSFVRSGDWVSSEVFYKRTLAAGGTSARMGLNLGLIYGRRGAYASAEQVFRKVLQMAPNYPLAQNNLADALSRQGKIAEAEKLFAAVEQGAAESRKDYPRTWVGALNHAKMRRNAGENDEALAILDRARADYPHVWEFISFESEILRQTKGPDAALLLVEEFARDNWWHYGAFLALGRLHAEKNDAQRAETALRHASWLDVHDVQALNLIATMQVRQNRLADACIAQRRAVSRQPDEPSQYLMLSDILGKMGRREEARLATAQFAHLQSLTQSQTAAN